MKHTPSKPICRRLLLCVAVAATCVSSRASGEERLFNDWPSLVEAAAAARPGDTLVLKNGQHDISSAVTFPAGGGGADGAPVTVRAESVGGCVLKGDSTAFTTKQAAGHIVVSGFKFQLQDETAVKLVGARHVRVTRCTFQLEETDSFDWLVITGAESGHNRVDHCLFDGKRQPGNYLTIDGDPQGQQSRHDRIDRNVFRDIGPRAKNEKEAVRVGWSEVSLSSGGTVIEHNYFERCDGDPEIISIKSCDNVVRFNTIVDCVGVLSLRHGDRSTVQGNVILGKGRAGCGGIRVYGDDHRVVDNYLAGLTGERFSAALAVTNGDADDAAPGKRLNAHFRPRRIQFVNNSLINNAHSIEIGYPRGGSKPWRKAPQELLFANNLVTSDQGQLVEIYTPPERTTWKNNRFWPVGPAELGVAETVLGDQVQDPELAEREKFVVATGPGDAVGARPPTTAAGPRAPRSAADVGPLAD